MEKVLVLKLIDGHFASAEAGKILNELIIAKINFLNREILSIKEKYNGDVSYFEKRIAELNYDRLLLKELLNNAQVHGKELVISSNIEIFMK